MFYKSCSFRGVGLYQFTCPVSAVCLFVYISVYNRLDIRVCCCVGLILSVVVAFALQRWDRRWVRRVRCQSIDAIGTRMMDDNRRFRGRCRCRSQHRIGDGSIPRCWRRTFAATNPHVVGVPATWRLHRFRCPWRSHSPVADVDDGLEHRRRSRLLLALLLLLLFGNIYRMLRRTARTFRRCCMALALVDCRLLFIDAGGLFVVVVVVVVVR